MDSLVNFWEMGGYAVYVWPAFGISALVLGGLLLTSLRGLRAREHTLTALRRDASSERRGDAL